MKKLIVLLGCIVMCLAMFTACSSENNVSSSNSSESDTSQSNNSSSSDTNNDSSSSEANSADNEILKQFIEQNKETFQVSSEAYDITIKAEDNVLVFDFSSNQEMKNDLSEEKKLIEDWIASQESLYSSIIDQLKSAGMESPKIDFRVHDINGELVTNVIFD